MSFRNRQSDAAFDFCQLDSRLRRGLVGQWLVSDFSGGKATDRSSYNRTGTLTGGPRWVRGPYNRNPALWFDGSNDYVDFGAQAGLILPAITVSLWCRWFEAPPAVWNGMAGNTDTAWGNGWGLYASTTNVIFFVEGYTANSATKAHNNILSWNHVCGTWDGATVQVYFNGVAGTSDAYAGSMTGTAAQFNIGRLFNYDAYNMSGVLHDVRVYNRALSLPEIRLLANPTNLAYVPHPKVRGGGARPRYGDNFFFYV